MNEQQKDSLRDIFPAESKPRFLDEVGVAMRSPWPLDQKPAGPVGRGGLKGGYF